MMVSIVAMGIVNSFPLTKDHMMLLRHPRRPYEDYHIIIYCSCYQYDHGIAIDQGKYYHSTIPYDTSEHNDAELECVVGNIPRSMMENEHMRR
jgi:hypothetical protein